MATRSAMSWTDDGDEPNDDPGGEVAPSRSGDSSRRLIEAAIEAFADRGFHATTTRDIATRVGLSPAALYVHFPSKQALLAEISVVGHEAALDLVERSAASGTGSVNRLRAVIRDFTAWHAERYRVARVVHHEIAALADTDQSRVLDVRRRIEGVVEAQLSAGNASGEMDVPDTRAVARALLSLSVDVARWYDPRGSRTAAQIGDLYADLATRMVSARPPAPPEGERT
ncbi:TetR/AcrR family transcriptional regulator [Kineosporia sp. NBRC 101731]|uniref:TetR/AcrR family transcriptional regulator n=1 Tax=Kineosporia sp. NBRC 101731 TaxID=3032199 RepID=UPI0024A44A08|nr:TetR/AcrR family transcriptional regulator [Kineosporia sp. NBRC 101731]GLY33107.1 TetR family transcriptional regulator [Kineosporia sp. NBRC 101731]